MRILIMILALFPSVHVFGQMPLTKPFEDRKIDGSITMYDYKAKQWIASDIQDSHVIE